MSDAGIMEPISAKLRHDEKKVFAEVCDSIGTTPSNAIRMFVSVFNKRGGFPFDPSNPYGFNQETLAAMDDAAKGRNLSGPYAQRWTKCLLPLTRIDRVSSGKSRQP